MKRNKIIITTSILTLIAGLLLWGYFIVRINGGPNYKILKNRGELKNSNLRLISNQRFNRIHGIGFYVVNFKLRDSNYKTFEIGNMIFRSLSWYKCINVFEVEDWILLSDSSRIWASILMANFNQEIRTETCFSPLELDLDTLWKSKYNDVLDWEYKDYSGRSVIDSIIKNRLYITYEYRVGESEPFNYYRQAVGYEMDLNNSNFTTLKIFERKTL